jgi:uncharacterized protein YdeI (YjbR/CyaY-like superfamily)
MIDVPKNSTQPKDRAGWRKWLEKNHTRDEGIWLITFKKTSGKPRIEYEEAVEEALCFGWIDSKPGKLDDERTMLWFSPRKKGSKWSKPNKERVARLTKSNLMHESGLAKVVAAKKDGTWTALDAVEALEVPEDLAKALKSYPHSQKFFEAFPRSVKRGILEWISSAKRPETRAKRIDETARLANENIRANQWKG